MYESVASHVRCIVSSCTDASCARMTHALAKANAGASGDQLAEREEDADMHADLVARDDEFVGVVFQVIGR